MKSFAENGLVEKEGIKYFSELIKFLMKNSPAWIPYAFVNVSVRFLGYRLGLMEEYIPTKIKSKLSFNKNFWRKNVKANS